MLLSFAVKVKLRGLAAWDNLHQSNDLLYRASLSQSNDLLERSCLSHSRDLLESNSLSPATIWKELVCLCPTIFWKECASVQHSVQELACLSQANKTSSFQQPLTVKYFLFCLTKEIESVVFITKLYQGKCPHQKQLWPRDLSRSLFLHVWYFYIFNSFHNRMTHDVYGCQTCRWSWQYQGTEHWAPGHQETSSPHTASIWPAGLTSPSVLEPGSLQLDSCFLSSLPTSGMNAQH